MLHYYVNNKGCMTIGGANSFLDVWRKQIRFSN